LYFHPHRRRFLAGGLILITAKKVTSFEGTVRSIEITTKEGVDADTLVLSITLKGQDGACDTRLTFSGFGDITVNWLLHSEYLITISEMEDTGWETKTFHVLVMSSNDFDFYATSVQIMRDL
jgi:hypothetical protein